MAEVTTLTEAIAGLVHDGDSVALEGFTHLIPFAAGHEILRQGRKDLERRIEEAGRHVDVDQLCLSPQCGFSSTSEGNVLSEEQQWDKLRLIVETAKSVWG